MDRDRFLPIVRAGFRPSILPLLGRAGQARLDEVDHAAATLTRQHHGRIDRRGGAGVEPRANRAVSGGAATRTNNH